MTRVLTTGSTTGLGAGAARELLELGHEVVLHARNQERAASVGDWFHQRRKAAPSAALDSAFQNALRAELVRLTDVRLA